MHHRNTRGPVTSTCPRAAADTVAVWCLAPRADETELVNRGARQREIEQENVRIAAKLDDRYKRRKDSFVTANQVCSPLLPQWA